jgi:hypoxanthine phosphoribosyltransferase
LNFDSYIDKIILSEETIQEKVKEIGTRISRDFFGKNPVLVNILKGGIVFLADLMRNITIPHEIDFLSVSSYVGSRKPTGIVRILNDLGTNIRDRHVILIEDVYVKGLTLHYIYNHLKLRKPASLKICTLLYKEKEREVLVPVEYAGFYIKDEFVIGYGLDYKEVMRNLPFIAILKKRE